MPNQNKIDYLILSAFIDEQAYLRDRLVDVLDSSVGKIRAHYGMLADKYCCFALTGMGTINAAAVTAALIQALSPKQVIFYGCSGAIRDDLKAGDIILGDQAFDIDVLGHHEVFSNTPFEHALINPHKEALTPEIFQCDSKLLKHAQAIASANNIAVKTDMLASMNAFPIAMQHFDTLKQKKIPCVDMESVSIYQVCWLYDVPSLVVRVISNGIDDDGNEDTDAQVPVMPEILS